MEGDNMNIIDELAWRDAINQQTNKLCCRTFWRVPESTPQCNGSVLDVNFEQAHQQR